MPSLLETAINESYAALDRGDGKALRRLATAQARAISALDKELAKIERIIEHDESLGRDSGTYLKQRQRLASFIVQADAEFAKYGQQVGATLTQAQTEAVAVAREFVPMAIESINGPAPISYSFAELPTGATKEIVAALGDGSPLSTLTRSFGKEASLKLNGILADGVAIGDSMANTARKMRAAVPEIGGARARTIVRTETLRAYRESSRRTMQANSDVVKGWSWFAARDRNTCPVCWAMHGTEFKLTASMATHPNCRCSMIPITKSWKELGFKTPKDTPLPKAVSEAGPKQFARLPETDKRFILGKGGYLAYKRGIVQLPDFVQETYSNAWGYGRSTKSLRSIVGSENAATLTRGKVPKSLLPAKPLKVGRNDDLVSMRIAQPEPAQRYRVGTNLEESRAIARDLGAPIVPRTADEALEGRLNHIRRSRPDFASTTPELKQWRKTELDIMESEGWFTDLDDSFLNRVQNATNQNYQNLVYKNFIEKNGGDYVIARTMGAGQHAELGFRSTRYTQIFQPRRNISGALDSDPEYALGPLNHVPGQNIRTLPAIIRHEYGHELERRVSSELYDTLPDADTISSGLSRYAATQNKETFCETFAVITDPDYNPADYPTWVSQFGGQLQNAIGWP